MLNEELYSQDAVTLAQNLLGCELVHKTPDGITAGIIVETEAYRQDDEASHSFNGQTPRNSIMFGAGGRAYVYFTYGMHYCMNVVCGGEGFAEAVLIRALEPIEGTELMKRRRNTDDIYNLCSGPAKLVQAMGITREHNGRTLSAKDFYIKPRRFAPEVSASPRIGISQAIDKPWRFFVTESKFVTKHRLNKLGVIPGVG
ncbi:MAG TPA: DNA-3-methyladenine glycosylase [Candidatus Dormibacteraeota bacterium]|nr:DNA-3-methyladenine glycosylase [Candidatus Dormibacteraeota bacterium]